MVKQDEEIVSLECIVLEEIFPSQSLRRNKMGRRRGLHGTATRQAGGGVVLWSTLTAHLQAWCLGSPDPIPRAARLR